MSIKKIYPKATIGIFGGGQLGRMLAQAAKKIGYNIITLDPIPNSPCAQIADEQIVAAFDDYGAAERLAEQSDVLTYEFENVNADIIEHLEKKGNTVFPSSTVLRITQNRIKEKEFLKKIGISVTDFRAIVRRSHLEEAKEELGLPAMLKTATGGYDGKGQILLNTEEDILDVPQDLFLKELIWERYVPFIKEISVICARGASNELITFPVSENVHRDNILYTSTVPARIPAEVEKKATDIARRISERLEVIGVIGVEMFLCEDGIILVNEIAPRVHNSGHYTIEACYTSQFEQHIRAICGLPLGRTELLSPVAMINILGEGKGQGGDFLVGVEKVLSIPGISLHLYGKERARAGRKMGHLTVLADSVLEAVSRAKKAIEMLSWE
ncbi:5-(carboxyamino)imidazole ribonucleotide synthase [candidate division NPL-UPA2 bacterium Unc8]|uniref:N5-carboxyaminoimidazole ribonucleotide synthase n=1 Tax=candidate division NPL-UPA2 bacterium Unc8 TaxID=1980939 RepID=A0A399FVI1_UNCN2|nr:N5-carboxyaminoimidazole ribonucleotide synthase [Bacillota bacterium]MBT9146534.1 N5-carboxyaminoimidazole ribonucleotide synthase [Bacillota bacterium]RII00435.1 MAG: 5-(carboxyamino)imidazole ribonucleotide synthase [candidate division NPL-UPA2 bacterium Unc8]